MQKQFLPASRLPQLPSRLRRASKLAAGLATALGLGGAVATAAANTVYPLACGDPAVVIFPTLRSTIAGAAEGDTVDLSKLNCATPSLITLAQGEIQILKNNLTISSPNGQFTIDAAGVSRIFNHKGTGTLSLNRLSLQNGVGSPGSYSGAGGCLRSAGSVSLDYTNVSGCTATYGGGIYSKGDTKLVHSSVSGNLAKANMGEARGGGVFAGGSLVAKYDSSISNNISESAIGGAYAFGGITTKMATVSGNTDNSTGNLGLNNSACTALATVGQLKMSGTTVGGNKSNQPSNTICADSIQIDASTITDNRGDAYGANVLVGVGVTLTNSTISGNTGNGIANGAAGGTVKLINSTISGNSAQGILGTYAVIELLNSTIAFNGLGGVSNAGLSGPNNYCSFNSHSSIISNNFSQLAVDGADVYLKDCTTQDAGSNLVDNNIIVRSNVAFPGATANITSDPRLAPLAYHGGLLKTHALSVNSPAIDAGNNLSNQVNDERGAGFAREVGAKADIGAYERQIDDDELFYGGFD